MDNQCWTMSPKVLKNIHQLTVIFLFSSINSYCLNDVLLKIYIERKYLHEPYFLFLVLRYVELKYVLLLQALVQYHQLLLSGFGQRDKNALSA